MVLSFIVFKAPFKGFFHRFPKKTSLRARWLHKIRRAGFSVTPHTKVCSRHFQDNEIHTTAKGRRVLAAGSVPSLFEWNSYTTKSWAGVWERRSRPPSPGPDSAGPVEDIGHPVMVPMVVDHDYGASRTVCVDREQYEDVLKNKLFDTTIPLSIAGSINQLFTFACLLSNYQNGPLVKKWRYEV
uniref:THAP domain-containing protein 1 n=1 Tax=Sinocyclocheilus anshuiensis TaxID=1608454 RepID=A0A671L5J2_9TELE